MTYVTDLMPFVSTMGGGFFVGLLAGYVIKKVIKIAAVIVDLFIAALTYLEYQKLLIFGLNIRNSDENCIRQRLVNHFNELDLVINFCRSCWVG